MYLTLRELYGVHPHIYHLRPSENGIEIIRYDFVPDLPVAGSVLRLPDLRVKTESTPGYLRRAEMLIMRS
jgi:hypothetical protein